ncbi:MAG: hypothetical protein JWR63_1575 [Conexibacter sp.]|nr:hypothetical protein [Conexibacter sp.]
MSVFGEHGRAIRQGIAVIACVAAAIAAPVVARATTELFLGSLAGGAVCSAWIFVTSKAGRAA